MMFDEYSDRKALSLNMIFLPNNSRIEKSKKASTAPGGLAVIAPLSALLGKA